MGLTVKDGAKAAFGAWLFFKLLGIAGCMALVGTGTCLFFATEAHHESKVQEAKAASPTSQMVKFTNECNVREKPSARSKKVGKTEWTAAGYPLLEQKGKRWVKIRLPDGTEGWGGCSHKIK